MAARQRRAGVSGPPEVWEGSEYRIHRVLEDDKWREAGESDTPKEPNAYVLLYAWTIGFEPTNEITSHNICASIDTLKRHLDRYRSDTVSLSAVRYFHELECFLLKHMPSNRYTDFLMKVKQKIDDIKGGVFGLADIVSASTTDDMVPAGKVKRLRWVAPDEATIVDWCNYLHAATDKDCIFGDGVLKGRGNNWGSLGLKISAISSISTLFGGPKVDRREATLALEMRRWKRGHHESMKQAPSFLISELDILHRACMDNPKKTGPVKKRTWVMFMLQLNVMARASCVTTHCPLQGTVDYPQDEDEHGKCKLPDWIRLVWLNWKRRNDSHVGSPYPIRLTCSNIENEARFDIVTLLLDWFNFLYENKMLDEAKPIFDISCEAYKLHLKDLFNYAAVITGDDKWKSYSSHSIRYSGTLWARICGANLHIMKTVGRWSDLKMLLKYIADGDQAATHQLLDLIEKTVVFKTVADGSRIGQEFPQEDLEA